MAHGRGAPRQHRQRPRSRRLDRAAQAQRGDRARSPAPRPSRRVEVVPKRKLNGAANVIARTGADIVYRKGQPALALLDFDTKGMPGDVAAALQRCMADIGRVGRGAAGVADDRPGDPTLDQRRPVPLRYRNATARLRRGARLCRGPGRHRHRAVPEDPARALLARWSRLDDGRRRRAVIGALDRRSHGLRARAPGVRGRPDPRSAAAPGQAKAASRWRSRATRSTPSRPARR